MLSINTNLSSLIAQRSMNHSTNALNLAIERMTTGFKINHAKDNAANYSISTNMSTKIGAYQVAEDNAAMGLDMVTTASEGLSLIERKLSRLRELAVQSSNGTYGSASQKAINAEAKAIVDEVKRVYNTAEYNGKKLYTDTSNNTVGLTTPTYTSQQVANMTTLTKAIENSSLTKGGEYSISSAEELAKLAEIVNNGTYTSGMTFVLANDIDLADWCEAHADTGGWVAIGNDSKRFRGIFDGNGHVIENLTIDKETADYQGLFGYAHGATIKNVGLENADVHGNSNVGSLVGYNANSTISNCYATGNVRGEGGEVGGLVGYIYNNSIISNCYADVDTSGVNKYVGGLLGISYKDCTVSNCYATGNVKNSGNAAGGLIGYSATGTINNCYASGNVQGNKAIGGLVGLVHSAVITNCYATGNVKGDGNNLGGLVGETNGSNITRSYATGNVYGTVDDIGGLVGYNASTIINNCYTSGKVQTKGTRIGGLVGFNNYDSSIISNSYALGQVAGTNNVGSLIGQNNVADSLTNCASLGGVKNGSKAESGDVLTLEEIRARYTDEAMGFTEENGWVIINGKQYLKGMIPAGVIKNTSLQIGIDSNSNSQIIFNMGFALDGIEMLTGIGRSLDRDYLSIIDNMLETVTAKQTKFGSIQNRLESVLDEVMIQRDNLVSSRSTLRDADIAEVSSTYIQQQILQQASATLMATANQSPAIALQLI